MPFEATENEIRHRVREPGLFEEGSFRSKDVGQGIRLILGKLSSTGKLEVQAIRFDKDKWSMEEAKKWISEHKDFSAELDETEMKKLTALYSIPDVHIFSAGKWNGDEYDEKDLDSMIAAFDKTKKSVRPFLKLGHEDNQVLLRNSGLPAAGWIDRIYRKGKKLYADFVDIPQKVYELIKNKAYRKVSAEIYWNIEIHGETFDKMLGAVALLGSETPGVMDLDDILAFYGLKKFDFVKEYGNVNNVKSYTLEEGKMPSEKTEQEIKLALELEAEKKKTVELEEKMKSQSALDKENEELRAYKTKAEAEKKDLAQKLKDQEIEKQVAELLSKKAISPAMKPYAKELLTALAVEEKKEYSVKTEKDEKKLSAFDLVNEFLKLHTATDVNLDERSEDGDKQTKEVEAKLIADAEKYAEQNKVKFSTALKILKSQKK